MESAAALETMAKTALEPLQQPPPGETRCDADASQASSHELFHCSWDAGEPRQLARRSWDASQESRHDLDSW